MGDNDSFMPLMWHATRRDTRSRTKNDAETEEGLPLRAALPLPNRDPANRV